jgi:N-acetylneuraminate lyase
MQRMAHTVKHSLQGILPAIVTPFDPEGRFDIAAFERLIARLYAAGVHGLYVCGQTGEGLQQPLEQRQRVAEAAVRCSPPGKLVIVHIGAASTAEAVELARHASKIGAQAVSSLPPAGPFSFEEVRGYYRDLAAASGVPLLIYYFPSFSTAIRTSDQILELCAIPNIVGLKFTDSDMFRLWLLRRAGAVVFNGSDEMLVAGLIMGANGGIGSIYNLLPERFVELYGHAISGRWQQARAMQDQINEVIEAILHYPVHAAVKAVLRWRGLDCGDCIAPRRRLTAEEEAGLRARLARTTLGAECAAAE